MGISPGMMTLQVAKENSTSAQPVAARDISGSARLSMLSNRRRPVWAPPSIGRWCGQFGTLSVMNGATNTLASTINIGGQPASLVDDPFTQRVYVNNAGLNAIQTIDARTNSIINTVPAGTQPEYSDIDFRTGLLYVENQDPAVLAFRTR
jgi:YVTN family beta-propeller protein